MRSSFKVSNFSLVRYDCCCSNPSVFCYASFVIYERAMSLFSFRELWTRGFYYNEHCAVFSFSFDTPNSSTQYLVTHGDWMSWMVDVVWRTRGGFCNPYIQVLPGSLVPFVVEQCCKVVFPGSYLIPSSCDCLSIFCITLED